MEERIVQLLQKRDENGLILLIDEYGKLVRYVIARIIGGHEEDIEEAVSSVYLKVWNNIETYDLSKGSLSAYLTVIARNTAINKLRKLKSICEDMSDIAEDYVDSRASLEDRMIKKEDMRMIMKIISRLKDEERELFERRFFYMQSTKTIAASMNLSITAVDNRISRLKEKIKKEFIRQNDPTERRIRSCMILFL